MTDTARAIEMLRVAARFIRQHAPDRTIAYDETECDGNCLAEDCEFAADDLEDGQ